MILASKLMRDEEPKKAADICLQEIALPPEGYRIGNTKACHFINISTTLIIMSLLTL